jgi:hypothetical protein
LKYAVKSGGSWSIETVDSAGKVGYYSSLALDSSGKAHISYRDASKKLSEGVHVYDLKYAVKSGDGWIIETVDSAGKPDRDISIAVDSSGNPHISYRDNSNQDLKYAVKSGDGWIIETIDSTGYVAGGSSIALDSSGNPHISYRDASNTALKYAVKSGGISYS